MVQAGEASLGAGGPQGWHTRPPCHIMLFCLPQSTYPCGCMVSSRASPSWWWAASSCWSSAWPGGYLVRGRHCGADPGVFPLLFSFFPSPPSHSSFCNALLRRHPSISNLYRCHLCYQLEPAVRLTWLGSNTSSITYHLGKLLNSLSLRFLFYKNGNYNDIHIVKQL